MGKLPKNTEDDSPVASMKISVAANGGFVLEIVFEDNRHPMTVIYDTKEELMEILNNIIVY